MLGEAVTVRVGAATRIISAETVERNRDRIESGEWRIVSAVNAGSMSLPLCEAPAATAPALFSRLVFAVREGLIISGLTRYVFDLAQMFAETYQIHIVTFAQNSIVGAWDWPHGVMIHRERDMPRFRERLKSLAPAIFHFQYEPNTEDRAAVGDSRVVFTIHNYAGNLAPRDGQVPLFGVRAVPHGIDLDVFKPRQDARRRGPFVVGVVARMSPEKIPDSFVSNLERRTFKNIVFRFIGYGPGSALARSIHSRLRRIHHVELCGDVPHSAMAEEYRDMDVLLIPSTQECMPYSALEAMATGLPVIARKLPSLVSLVGDHGIFEEDDGRLLDAVENLAADRSRAHSLGMALRSRVAERHNAERMREHYERTYRGRETKPEPPALATRSRKSVVLVIYDCKNWAFHHIAQQIQRRCSDLGEIIIAGINDDLPAQADIIVSLWWDWFARLQRKVRARRFIVALYDHHLWGSPANLIRAVECCDTVVFANQLLADELKDKFMKRTLVCADGVDCDLFTPQSFPGHFTVGWTGSINAFNGPIKGVEYIEQACKIINTPFLQQTRERRELPHSQMPEGFYKKISVYVCASRCEGTPNPVLEAAACGRPIVTTRVGITGDLITEGVNGHFVERNARAIADAFMQVRERGPETYSFAAREAALKFDWSEKIKPWREAIFNA